MSVGTDREVTVTYEVKPITATEGEDYIADAGTIVFLAGTTAASIDIEIIVDEFAEEDEQFRVVLTSSSNGLIANGLQEAIGTIRNDDTVIQVSNEGYEAANEYPGRTLVWSDEFDASQINPQHWTYDLGASGWGNQELQNYTSNSENSYVSNGNLMIVAKKKRFTIHLGTAQNPSGSKNTNTVESMSVPFCLSDKGFGQRSGCWEQTSQAQDGRLAGKSTSWSSLDQVQAASTERFILATATPSTNTREAVDTFRAVKRLRMNSTFFPLTGTKMESPGCSMTNPFIRSTTAFPGIKTTHLTTRSSSS